MLEKAFGSLLEIDGQPVTPSVGMYPQSPTFRNTAPIPVTKTEPWPHQTEAYNMLDTLLTGKEVRPMPTSMNGAALFMDMGT
jgi:hypothetical protein